MKKRETLGYDLVVEEEELQTQLQRMYEQASSYEDTMEQYLGVLQHAVVDSVTGGNTAENLKLFWAEAAKLQGEIGELVKMIYALTVNYQSAIDEADSYLY